MRKNHLSLMLLLVLLLPAFAQAKRDPCRDWQQTATEHFLLIYPRAIAPVAAQAAMIAETAYPRVKALFGYAPPGRTPVVLNPDADVANGYSTGIYTKMEFYLASPTGKWGGTLNTSWLESLMYHEYAHLCHGLRAQGFTRILTLIFGGVNAVNFISPQWWNEGVAEYSETALTPGGRGRSAYHTMKLAANLLSEDPWSLGQMGTPPRYDFPFDRAYVGGLAMVEQLHQASGRENFIDLASAQQSAWPVFGLGFVWRRALHQRVNAVFDAMLEQKREAFHRLFGASRAAAPGAEDWTRVPHSQFEQPHWTQNQSLVAYASLLDSGPALVQLTPGSRPEVLASPAWVNGRLAYAPRTRTFFYARVVPGLLYDGTEISDLFRRDDQGERRLTFGVHAWSPDVSADGRLVCVVNDCGLSHLALVDPGTGALTAIPSAAGALYLSPRWSPDGKSLAAAVRINGHQDICLVDLPSGALTPLTGWDLPGDHDPAWSPDGSWVYFVSDRTGVHQVYASRLATRELFQVTDAYLGAFDPAVSPDGKKMAFAEYRLGQDQQIVTMPLDPAAWKPAGLPVPAAQPEPSAELMAPAVAQETYSAWPHLLPSYWIPSFGEDRDGLTVGVLSARQDPLELHAWQAQVLTQPLNGKVYGEAVYTNDVSPSTLGVRAFSRPFFRWRTSDDFVSATRDWARQEGFAVSDTWALHWLSAENRSGVLQITGVYETYRILDADPLYFKDTAFSGVEAGLQAAYLRQAPRDMFPTAGWVLQGQARRALPGHGYDGRLAWAGVDFVCPGVKHEALVLGARAASRLGDFPDSFTEVLPLGYHDDQRPFAAKIVLAHRFPLWYLDFGPDVLPLFAHALWGEVEGDWGQSMDTASMGDWKARARYSASLILHLELEAFWYLPLRLDQVATVTQDGAFEIKYLFNAGF